MAQENGGLFSKLLFPAPNPLSLQLPCSSVFTTPMGKIKMGKATIAEMSKKSGMVADTLIRRLQQLIGSHT